MKKEDVNEARAYSDYVIGIISIVTAFITSWGIGGIVFGIIGLVRVKKDKGIVAKKAKMLNRLGLIFGAIVFLASLVSAVIFLANGGWDLSGLSSA